MNTTQLIVNSMLTLLLPALIGFVYAACRVLAQRLPEHQRQALEQFATLAAKKVEQQYADNPAKKQLAVDFVTSLFQAFKLPVPSPTAIDVAIEAAVFEINQISQNTQPTQSTQPKEPN